MGTLIIYLLTLAAVGTVAFLEFFHDLENKLNNHNRKEDKNKKD